MSVVSDSTTSASDKAESGEEMLLEEDDVDEENEAIYQDAIEAMVSLR